MFRSKGTVEQDSTLSRSGPLGVPSPSPPIGTGKSGLVDETVDQTGSRVSREGGGETEGDKERGLRRHTWGLGVFGTLIP